MKPQHGDPRMLTFSQAQGYEEIPQRLRLEELSKLARTKIWDVLFASLSSDAVDQISDEGELWGLDVVERMYVGLQQWDQILRDKHLALDNLPLDEWSEPLLFSHARDELRQLVMAGPFHKIFDLIQFVLGHPNCPGDLVNDLKKAFEKGMLAYVIDDNGPPTIFPACTVKEGQSLTECLHTLQQAGLSTAEDLFREASRAISRNNWTGSINSSISAVESVARRLYPQANTLGDALKELRKNNSLWPPQLVQAIQKIWNYTNQKNAGIRHGSPDLSGNNVGQNEALFMLGACASVASYLWRKHSGA